MIYGYASKTSPHLAKKFTGKNLSTIIRLYRDVTGDMRVFRFNNTEAFIYAERAVLGMLILSVAMIGGLLFGWVVRRRSAVRLAK
jgi:hypothetical protein